MLYRNRELLASIVALVLLMAYCSPAHANTRLGGVTKDGQVLYGSSLAAFASARPNRSGEARPKACTGQDLLFTFEESVSVDRLELSRRNLDSGEIAIEIVIQSTCDAGTASFRYSHEALQGVIGDDILISPVAPTVSVELSPGSIVSQTVTYQVVDRDARGEDDKLFELQTGGITFVVGDFFGQASRPIETLAEISVQEGPPLDTDDPELAPADDRTADAARAFNNACEDPAASAQFSALCDAAAAEADTPEEVAQIAEAFDPHELTAAPAAVSEGGRVQAANIGGRLAALRGGATGLSLSGIALAYNGDVMDQSWLPLDDMEDMHSGSGGGSSLLSDRWGFFVNGEISLGDRDRRGKEFGFDFDSWGLTTGIDYRFPGGFIGGLSLGYSRYDADLDDDGGALNSDTVTFQGYGTYPITDNFYIDATLGYSIADLDQDRVIDLTGIGDFGRSVARGSTDAEQYSTSLAVNYRLPVETAWQVTTYGQFFYAVNQIDGFAEEGSPLALRFPDQEFFTQSYSGGLRASRAISFSNGVLSPFVDAGFTYERGNDGYAIRPAFVDGPLLDLAIEISDPDRRYGRIDTGMSWVFLSGQQLFFSYSALVGESDTTRHAFYLGARFEF